MPLPVNPWAEGWVSGKSTKAEEAERLMQERTEVNGWYAQGGACTRAGWGVDVGRGRPSTDGEEVGSGEKPLLQRPQGLRLLASEYWSRICKKMEQDSQLIMMRSWRRCKTILYLCDESALGRSSHEHLLARFYNTRRVKYLALISRR